MSASPSPPKASGVDTALYHQLYAFQYVAVVTLGVFVWELIITLPTEYGFYKKGGPRPTLLLLSLSRYFTLICLVIDVAFHLAQGASVEFCHNTRWVLPFLAAMIQVVSLPLLLLRTYAIWGRNQFIGGLLLVLWTGTIAVGAYTCTTYEGIPYSVFIGLDVLDGCTANPLNNWGTAPFIVNLIVDSSIFILTLAPLLSSRSLSSIGRTSRILIRDGILYYVVVVAINLINIIFFIAPSIPPLARSLIATPATIAPAIMVGRLFINLQHVFLAPELTVDTRSLVFRSTTGNNTGISLGRWTGSSDMYTHTQVTITHDPDGKVNPISSSASYPPQPPQQHVPSMPCAGRHDKGGVLDIA